MWCAAGRGWGRAGLRSVRRVWCASCVAGPGEMVARAVTRRRWRISLVALVGMSRAVVAQQLRELLQAGECSVRLAAGQEVSGPMRCSHFGGFFYPRKMRRWAASL